MPVLLLSNKKEKKKLLPEISSEELLEPNPQQQPSIMALLSVSSPCCNMWNLKKPKETQLPKLNSWVTQRRKVGLVEFGDREKFAVKASSCPLNPNDEPILKEAVKEPVAFLGGIFAGLLRLDLNEDPLKEWVTRTVEASGITEEIDDEGSKPEEQFAVGANKRRMAEPTIQHQEESEEEEEVLMKIGSYEGKVRVLREGEESAAEEMMLLWGIQQPTSSKPNAFVAQASLQLRLDACGHSISILQSPSSLGTPGVTGSVMWDSGIVLGKFLEHAVDSGMLDLQGKKVVELGSGCGLVGCIAALLGAQVVLTDLPDRLRLLRKNVEANLGHGDVRGSAVDLLDTLVQLCGTQTTLFLAGELRNDAVLECFLEAAMKNFVVGRVEQTQWHPDYCSRRVVMYILFLQENTSNRSMSSITKQPATVITCRAAVAWGAGQDLVIEEVEVNPPQPQEIRIKVAFTSLCGSDLSALESKENAGNAGIVPRRRGLMHSDQGTRFSIKGKPVYHFCAVSSFSEYTVVHSGCAVKVSPAAPLEKLCLLSCGAATGLGAAWNVADITKGSTVVIFGLGTVGLSVAQGAKIRGASQIIGVDTNPDKYEKAKDFGITDFINPADYSEPIQEVIKRATNGGADYSFECTGNTEVVTAALHSCCDGWGLAVTLGVPKGKPEISAHYALFLGGRTLKGSLFGGWKPKSDLPSLVDMYMKKEIHIDEFITHNLPFEDINKAFKLMREGKCLRCVIHMPK
ncbi:hypothetical protein Tsubulata_016437 [Turnera subulata]|uniref:Alcohol dehydrogenase-like C-terminal domain-containing protein n=1 Tax=Turnera subulata TaxID=218843 RepID=A0A9Q0F5B5_9ROSI|nr:hypothetical protein Tsubulata_016437 [Turnera subulata]